MKLSAEIRRLIPEVSSNLRIVKANNEYPNSDVAIVGDITVDDLKITCLFAEIYQKVADNISVRPQPMAELIVHLVNHAEEVAQTLERLELAEEVCNALVANKSATISGKTNRALYQWRKANEAWKESKP